VKRLAHALEATRLSRSRILKEETLAAAFADLGRDSYDEDGIGLATAARLAIGRTLPVGDPRPLGAGYSLMMESIVLATGFSAAVVSDCARRTGDLGEAFALLVARDERAVARPGLSLPQVADLFEALASTGNRLEKRQRLDEAFKRATPLETKYLAKALLGSLRVGAQAGVVEGAIARAFEVNLEELRRAGALVTDAGTVAVLARDGRLDAAHLILGRPVAYMLATPIETIKAAIDPALHVMEDKIDGVRAQLHKVNGEVQIFARGLEQVTAAFPEVVSGFLAAEGDFALDGELVALSEEGRPRPFQALQARLRRISPDPSIVTATPVTFIAYDLLADGERDLLSVPWRERRACLEQFAKARAPRGNVFMLNPVRAFDADAGSFVEKLDVAFLAARVRGHEGIVLKRIDSPYEAGRRGQAWIKVKRAFATLDVVVTAAEEGHGRRAGVLSDYTFAVWRGEELVNVGKAYSGLTDLEIDDVTRRLEPLTVERVGGLRLVRPQIVLEVAFDGVQPSSRHESGFALRFPRILRIRADKQPAEADTVDAVEALFSSQVETGHRERTSSPKEPRRMARNGSKKGQNTAQLSLFGDAAKQKK
jgi:DNA ligase-1